MTPATIPVAAHELVPGLDIVIDGTPRRIYSAGTYRPDAPDARTTYRIDGPEPLDARVYSCPADTMCTVVVPDVSGIPEDTERLQKLDRWLDNPRTWNSLGFTYGDIRLVAAYLARGDEDLQRRYEIAADYDLAQAFYAQRRWDAGFLRIAARAAAAAEA